MDIKENLFIKKWLDEFKKKIKIVFPDMSDDIIERILIKLIKNKLRNPNLIATNTYTNTNINTTMLSLLHWLEKEKPIVCANGSFYMQHDKEISPITEMIVELMEERDHHKSLMKQYLKEKKYGLAYDEDLFQNNVKIKTNSIYGAMGAKTSDLYNVSTASAITSQGRSIISTTLWFIEYFIGNNIIFDNLDDIIIYIENIYREYIENKEYFNNTKLDIYEPSIDHIIRYLLSKIYVKDVSLLRSYDITRYNKYYGILYSILKNFDRKLLTLLFYKNNLYAFFHNCKDVYNIIDDIYTNTTTAYPNPYDIPDIYKEPISRISDLVGKFVFYNYIVYDKIKKFIEYKRNVVIYSDTDSVFINLEYWVMLNIKLFENKHRVEAMDNVDIKYKATNVLTNIINIYIHKIYDKLTENMNIKDKWKKMITIKSEYLYDRFILFITKKKSYIYRELIKEGVLRDPPKYGNKGGGLNSKSKNPYVTTEINDIIKRTLIDPKKIEPNFVVQQIISYYYNIIDSLRRGEYKYLNPVKIKRAEEYISNDGDMPIDDEDEEELDEYEIYNDTITDEKIKRPLHIYKYRGMEIFNLLSDDIKIEPPDTAMIVDTIVYTVDDLDIIKNDFPNMYEKIKTKIFGDPELAKYGMKYICLPYDLNKIPEWIIPIINVHDIAKKHINPLISLLPSLGIKIDTINTTSKYFSTIINI